MIGWWIVIAAQTPEERDTGIGRRDAVLANWETSVGGNGWVQRLVDEGKAVQLLSGGYPNRYTAKASDVLPIIENGPPARNDPAVIGDDHVMPVNRVRDVVLHHDKIAACPPGKKASGSCVMFRPSD